MSDTRKKDNLTDLVDVVSSSGVEDSRPDNNGEVSLPTGDKVTLGFKVLAQKLVNAVRIKKQNEDIVRKQLHIKDKK
jgi:hypothetical protein